MICLSAPGDTTAILALLESSGLPTADLTGAHSVQMWSCHVGKALAGVIGLQRFGTDGLLRSLVVVVPFAVPKIGCVHAQSLTCIGLVGFK